MIEHKSRIFVSHEDMRQGRVLVNHKHTSCVGSLHVAPLMEFGCDACGCTWSFPRPVFRGQFWHAHGEGEEEEDGYAFHYWQICLECANHAMKMEKYLHHCGRVLRNQKAWEKQKEKEGWKVDETGVVLRFEKEGFTQQAKWKTVPNTAEDVDLMLHGPCPELAEKRLGPKDGTEEMDWYRMRNEQHGIWDLQAEITLLTYYLHKETDLQKIQKLQHKLDILHDRLIGKVDHA